MVFAPIKNQNMRTGKYCFTKKALNKFNAPGTGRELERTFSKLVEITQSKSHYAVQGHLRSPISVPIESSYTTSY